MREKRIRLLRYVIALAYGILLGGPAGTWLVFLYPQTTKPDGLLNLISFPVVAGFVAVFAIAGTALVSFVLDKLGRHIPKISARKCVIIASLPLVAALILLTILNRIASAEVERELAKIKAAGQSLSIRQLAGPKIPNDRNAAPLLEVAFRLLDLGNEEEQATWRFGSLDYAAPPELFDQVLARNEEALQFAERALERPECRFELDYSAGAAVPLPHLIPLSSISRLLRLRAVQKAHNGDMAGALADIRLIISLSQTLRREPVVISSLVRIAGLLGSAHALQDILEIGTPPADAIADLMAALRSQDLRPGLRLGMMGDRALGWQTLNDLASGRTHWRTLGTNEARHIEYYRFFWARPLLRHDQAVFLRWMRVGVENAGRPPHELKEVINSLNRDFRKELHRVPLANMLASALSTNSHLAAAVAQLHTAQLALALLRFHSESPKGELPKSLSELVPNIIPELPLDPFTGKQYVYRRTPDGAIICSLGANGKDDADGLERYEWKDDVVFRLSVKPGRERGEKAEPRQ